MSKLRRRVLDRMGTALVVCSVLVCLSGELAASASADPPRKQRYDTLATSAAASFVTFSKWNHRALTYGFANGTADIAGDGEKQAVREAFDLWSASTPLVFEEVEAAKAEIVISWATGSHGDSTPFFGMGGDLAHASYPSEGDIHFDDDEIWTTAVRPDGAQPIDLVSVAAHEIGHAIGLGHSKDATALMYGGYEKSHRYLAADDISGALSLYESLYGPESQRFIGFQEAGEELGVYGSQVGGWIATAAVAPGTSPSAAYVPGDGLMVAYQSPANELWLYRPATDERLYTGLGMDAGSSPSIAAGGNGRYLVAFQANNHELWSYSSTGQSVATKLGLEPGTSPSAGFEQANGYVIAFQDWQHSLWTYSVAAGTAKNTKLGMMPGTNPSLGAIPGGGYAIAFQDWQGHLWLYSSATGSGGNSTLGMDSKSSPSIGVKPGGTFIASFQANNHELWFYSSATNLGVPTKSGMAPGTSPSADWDPAANGYAIAFQDWQNHLWTYSTASGSWVNTSLTMRVGTSPALALR